MRIFLAVILSLSLFGCDKGGKKDDAGEQSGGLITFKPAKFEKLKGDAEKRVIDITESLRIAEILGFSHKIYPVDTKLSDIIEIPGEFTVEQEEDEDETPEEPAGEEKDKNEIKSLVDLKAAINSDNCYSKRANEEADEDSDADDLEGGALKVIGKDCPIRTTHEIIYNGDPKAVDFSDRREFKIRKSKHQKFNDVYAFESMQKAIGSTFRDVEAEKVGATYVVTDEITLSSKKEKNNKISIRRELTQKWIKNSTDDLLDTWEITLLIFINFGEGDVFAWGEATFKVIDGVTELEYKINDVSMKEDAEDFTRVFGMSLNGFSIDKEDTTDGNDEGDGEGEGEGEEKVRAPKVSMRCKVTVEKSSFYQPICLRPTQSVLVRRRVGGSEWMAEITSQASEKRDYYYNMHIKLIKAGGKKTPEESVEIKSTAIKAAGTLSVDKHVFVYECKKVSSCR